MKKMLSVAIAALSLVALSFAQQDEPTGPKYYDNAKLVRIRYTSGEVIVKRSYDEGAEEATVNLPLFENDELTTTDGRVEVYLGRLNSLRLDNDTSITFVRIPYSRKTDATFRIARGGIYLDVTNLDYEKSIEVQTPDCGIFLLDRGLYRFNVLESGETEVLVFSGLAEVAGTNSSRNVRENQKIVMASGEMEQRPSYFYASERDDFDAWNESRTRELSYARFGTSHYLESGYEDYEYELSRNGRWTYMDEFHSYCWIPYSLEYDWSPYYNGRWMWHPSYGYYWNSYDSWGWFPHYYGRWQWHDMYGWYWVPGYHWSPAWVYWFWDDYYYGWCPMSYWNTPVVIYNNRWDRHYNWRRGIPFHSSSSIIIHRNELINPHIRRVSLASGERQGLGNRLLPFRGNGPSERPAFSKVTIANAAGRPVVFKQNGIVSNSRYTPQASGEAIRKGGNAANPSMRYSGSAESSRVASKYSSRERPESQGAVRSGEYRSGYSSRSSRSSDSSSSSGYRSSSSGERSSGSSSRSSSSSSKSSSSSSSGEKKKDEDNDSSSSSSSGYRSSSSSGERSSGSSSGSSSSSSKSSSSSSSGEKKKDQDRDFYYYSGGVRPRSDSRPIDDRYLSKSSDRGGIGYSYLPRYTGSDSEFRSSSRSSSQESGISSGTRYASRRSDSSETNGEGIPRQYSNWNSSGNSSGYSSGYAARDESASRTRRTDSGYSRSYTPSRDYGNRSYSQRDESGSSSSSSGFAPRSSGRSSSEGGYYAPRSNGSSYSGEQHSSSSGYSGRSSGSYSRPSLGSSSGSSEHGGGIRRKR